MNNSKNTEIMVKFEVDGDEVKLTPKICKDYIVSGSGDLSLAEFKFFVTLCKKMNLNPFAKDCYILKYSNNQPATIITSKDVIFRRAMSHPDFDGLENGVIVKKEDGTIEEREGGFVLDNEVLVGAWAKAYRKSVKHPYYVSVPLKEVIQIKRDGTPNAMWGTKPAMMAIKVCSVRALRDMFNEDLHGLYERDEINDVPVDIQSPEHLNGEIIEQAEPIETEAEETVSMSEL